MVYLGRLADVHHTHQTPVTIKTLKEEANTKQDFVEFLQEAILLKDYNHENVLNVIGAIVERHRAFAILPYMENGELRSFISNDENVRNFHTCVFICIQPLFQMISRFSDAFEDF